MKHFYLSLFVVLLLSIATGAAQQQPKKAVIAGIVAQAGTATPIPAARVTLTRQGRGGQGLPAPVQTAPGQAVARGGRGAPVPEAPSVMTDEAGRFSFPDVDEGGYTLSVLANGYVGYNYGQRYAGGPGTPVNVIAGQEVQDIAMGLTPAGNISGRIVDTADEPLINVPVQLFRYSYDAQGQRTYQSAGNTVTNDRGEYRLYWLTPGRYYLMAGRNSASSANPMLEMAAMMIGRNATINNVNLPPAPMNYAYYPGVTDVSEARPIELPPGAEVNGVDLRLTPKPRTYRVRGRVLDPRTGQPPPRASVAMSPKTLDTGNSLLAQLGVFEEGMPNRNYDAKTGVFDFKDLLPGVYNLMVSGDDPQPDPNAAPRGEGGRSAGQPRKLTATSTIVISQEDVDGLVVSVMPAAAITGQIRVDGSLPQSTSLERMRVMLTSAPTGGSANPLQTTTSSVKPDGGFRLENVAPGDYRVRVMATPGARGGPTPPVNINIYIKEARFEGVDALNMPLRVSGPAAGSFELVVGVGGGQVNGSVLDSRQRPAPVTQVTLIPTRNRDRTDLYKTVTTDENGRFTITDIVPGDYKVFSWESVEPFGWFDPELLSASENSGRPVNVTESSAETIEVRLIAAGGAQ